MGESINLLAQLRDYNVRTHPRSYLMSRAADEIEALRNQNALGELNQLFGAILLNHYEGSMITEELLQQAMSRAYSELPQDIRNTLDANKDNKFDPESFE